MKDKFKHELPPCNTYTPNYNGVKQKSPATGLGYGERPAINRTLMSPGPGAYKSPSAMGEGPTYILGARLNDPYTEKKAKEMPSPNAYNPHFEVLAKTQSVFSIGKSLREDIAGPNRMRVPGPGSYAAKLILPSFQEAPKWGFGSSERPSITQQKNLAVPGPGSYMLKSTFADVPAYLIPN